MKLTKKHFELFKSECLRLQKKWGLLDWRIDFGKGDLDGNAAAQMEAHVSDGVVKIAVDDEDKSDTEIKEHAKHEMLHLLLARLYFCAKERESTIWDIRCAEHAVIRQLEKMIE